MWTPFLILIIVANIFQYSCAHDVYRNNASGLTIIKTVPRGESEDITFQVVENTREISVYSRGEDLEVTLRGPTAPQEKEQNRWATSYKVRDPAPGEYVVTVKSPTSSPYIRIITETHKH